MTQPNQPGPVGSSDFERKMVWTYESRRHFEAQTVVLGYLRLTKIFKINSRRQEETPEVKTCQEINQVTYNMWNNSV